MQPSTGAMPVHILVDACFPFSSPSIYLSDAALFLKIPHIEVTGKLCLLPANARVSPSDPVGVVEWLIRDAKELIENGLNARNTEDFAEEFNNYWNSRSEVVSPNFLLFIDPTGPSRNLVYFPHSAFTLIAEDAETGEMWLKNWGFPSLKSYPTRFVWLNSPLLPSSYPATNYDVALIAQADGSETFEALCKFAPGHKNQLPVLLGFESKTGPAFAGVVLKASKKVFHGFRCKSKLIPELLPRYFSDERLAPKRTHRIDPMWIHSRGGPLGGADSFFGKKAVLIGCGSLGSDIAYLLAKSGVGTLTLIDYDIMNWDNVGRHLLGADAVARSKVAAVKKLIENQLPHISVNAIDADWEKTWRATPNIFQEADVIISTTAVFKSESLFNCLKKTTPDFPPIIFGWAEPYGCAGHALLVMDAGGCLSCGMSDVGDFSYRVCKWDGETTLKEPACGDSYQPYSILDVEPIKTMIAELALEVLNEKISKSQLRTWVGSRIHLEESKGSWTTDWISKHGSPGDGRIFASYPWEKNPDCKSCKLMGKLDR